jgi:hypothetical protein
MARRYLYLPSPYTAMLRRVTLIVLLIACGCGIALDRYVTSEMRLYNQSLGEANEQLLSRANLGVAGRGQVTDTTLAAQSTAPATAMALANQ